MRNTRRALALVLAAMLIAMTFGAMAGEVSEWKVTIFDSDGTTVLAETTVKGGETVVIPELTKDGYTLSGLFVTPALLRPFDAEAAITKDTSLFAAWESAVVDERPWMIAGSLSGYPENNWGHAWPQDDFLLKPVEGAVNTFEAELNLYAGDEFKIAVIDENYGWYDNVGGSALVPNERGALSGGEDAFNSGANIKVKESGKYRLTLTTDAETLSLCKLAYEIAGDADAVEHKFNFQVQGDFNGWGANPEDNIMAQTHGENEWSITLSVPEGETWTFGIKNLEGGDWYDLRKVDPTASPNITIEAGGWEIRLAVDTSGDELAVTAFTVTAVE
ncbi:MAG: hypothetical protein LBD16_03625 [Oscillospiraceae bacterium]|jgi:hypothetical protein|nr:hypothetical protein [Oscillospiraceae bacterium]